MGYGCEFFDDNRRVESVEANGEDYYDEFFEALSDTLSNESDEIESSCSNLEGEKSIEFSLMNVDDDDDDHGESFDLEEEEKSKLVFKFQYQNWDCKFSEELKGDFSESSDFDKRGEVSSSANKYEFVSEKSFSRILDQPEAANFTVKEFFIHSNDDFPLEKNCVADDDSAGLSSERKLNQESCEEVVDEKILDSFSERLPHVEEVSEKLEPTSLSYERKLNEEICEEVGNGKVLDSFSEKLLVEEVSEKLEPAGLSPERKLNGECCEEVVDEKILDSFAEKVYVEEVSEKLESACLSSERKLNQDDCEEVVNGKILDSFSGKMNVEEMSEKLKNSEPYERNFLLDDDFICSSSDTDSTSSLESGFLSDTDFGTTTEHDTLGNNEESVEDLDFKDDKSLESLDFGYEPDDFAEEDEDIMNELGKLEEEIKQEQSAKQNSKSVTAFDLEESNRFDTLWEHQDLIEQLKMELKKVKATGLPTIFEDAESPRIMEDLKPWKIDEKFQHGSSTTNELPKFYRSYRERMRKFDILNYQKMYALGLMKLKDPLQSFSVHKKSSSTITSLFKRNKEIDADPMKKFIRELYSDLEMVYVGHLCLSWEFLHWEYEKALKIWENDQYGFRRFNEVAGEFQQFQVLLQRFIENEPFQCPRVENYARNRCAMKNLLQVPVIREDKGKDKKKLRKKEVDNDAITSDMLVEILEESIRTIWRFIRGDKDASNLTIKSLKEHHVELQDPADSQLLVEILTDLQKKEKRLREILRSGSCILKKFKKHNEEETDPVLYFFSQVDMKLVWRVLNMSRITTDQLGWCRSKLNNINFVNKRIHVESSFLLFPT
ncbi:unnamed protein product [Lathyrus oleraceus]|uniref:Ribosomal protein L34Ae n=2 Tax=Pisum sativum TaxID=3888 RepID=A0A9D4Y3N1_PEA|nr:uncharacterized protein LOC127128543 isoform X2 [Pisum sativum]XP_050913848.1 uncharacterized protein LOC127128543 isoform X2 [Pisum sativum]KAI5432044.1 hypothetical protein KIW84_035977 [Pisum sativum]